MRTPAFLAGLGLVLIAILPSCGTIEGPSFVAGDRQPDANAGPDISEACVGSQVALDGNGSSDVDGDSLSFSWTQTAGPSVTLDGRTSSTPAFTPSSEDVFEFALTVTDGRGLSDTDSVRVSVTDCGADDDGGDDPDGGDGGPDGSGTGDSDSENDDGDAGAPVPPSGGSMTLAVTAHPDPVGQDDSISYQIVLGNNGEVDLHQVTLTTPHLSSWDPFFGRGRGVDCDGDGEIDDYAFCGAGDLITWPIGNLPISNTRTIVFAPSVYFDVDDLAGIQLVVTATSLEAVTATATRTVTVRSEPPLGLAATADRSSVSSGDETRLTLDFQTSGTGVLQNATLRASIPSGTVFVSASEEGQSSGTQVTWELGQLEAGSVGSRQFSVEVGDGLSAGSLILIEADLAGTLFDSGVSSAQAARAQAVVPMQ